MLTEEKKASIRKNLLSLQSELGKVQLVAVSKYSPADEIVYAYELGQRVFGENRVLDLQKKAEALSHLSHIEWHFIGHLQRNKVKDLLTVTHLSAIHSVDSQALLEKIISCRRELKANEKLDLFFEVNTSGEKEKNGFSQISDLELSLKKVLIEGPGLGLCPAGLMTMGTFRTDDAEAEAHRCFKQLRSMKNELEKSLGMSGLRLSMGMSSDYQIALQYGADVVRIGSHIFK